MINHFANAQDMDVCPYYTESKSLFIIAKDIRPYTIEYMYVFTFQLFVVLPYLLRSEIYILHQTLDPIKPSIAFDTRDGGYKPVPPTV